MIQEIPNTSIQIQEGLYWDLHAFTVKNSTHYSSRLYSSEGYCFYDKTAEYYDEEGVLITDESILKTMRNYMQFCCTPEVSREDLNNRFVSVPIEDSFTIV